MKKRIKKVLLLIGIIILVGIGIFIFDCIRYVYNVFYTNIDLTYLGTAEGVRSERIDPPGFWLSFRYL